MMRMSIICFFLSFYLNGFAQVKLTVHFDFDKSALTPGAMRQLDSLIRAKKEANLQYIIELNGYCDAIGSDGYNQALSENRVSTVKEYLLSNGIAASDITNAKGHGEHNALNENKTEEERQVNRRVELTLIENAQLSLSQKQTPATNDNRSLTEKIADSTVKAGSSIVLKNMNFYGGTPFLLPESSPVVDELIQIMQQNPTLVIEIQGHICCVAYPGDSPYVPTGNGLSEERARSIYAELIGHGIDAKRVSYKGFGHSQPIYPYPEQTEDERIANRRVEVKIIKK